MVQLIRRCRVGVKHDPVAEGGRLALLQREIQGLFLRVKHADPQRIGGKKSVSARVPGGRIPGVLRLIEDSDGDRVAVLVARERAPSAAC